MAKRTLAAAAPTCQELAAEIRTLEGGLTLDVCLPSWTCKQRKWVNDLLKIEDSECADNCDAVVELAKLTSELQACIKPAHQAGWLAGSSLKAWRARLHGATETDTVQEAVEALTAAIQLQPEPPAWLAAATSPPAPGATAALEASPKSPIEPNHLSFASRASAGHGPDPAESSDAADADEPAEVPEEEEVIDVDDDEEEAAIDAGACLSAHPSGECGLASAGVDDQVETSEQHHLGDCSKGGNGLPLETDSTGDSLVGADDGEQAADQGDDGRMKSVGLEDPEARVGTDDMAGLDDQQRGYTSTVAPIKDAAEGTRAASAASTWPMGILSTILPRGLVGFARWCAGAPK
jgi:hypothetical protein